jgi:hypothetical protein
MCVVSALTTHCVPAQVKKGFVLSGMVGQPGSWKETTRKTPFGKRGVINKQTTPYYQYTANDWRLIDEKFDEMVEEFLNEGRLSDAYLDNLGMPRSEDQVTDKEEYVVYRWRCTILNHGAVIQELDARAEIKADAEKVLAATKAATAAKKQRKTDAVAPLKKLRDLVDRLVVLRDATKTALVDCNSSVSDAKKKNSTGLNSCKIQRDIAKEESENVHVLWRGGFDKIKTCKAFAEEGDIDEIETEIEGLNAVEQTAKDAAARAAAAAVLAKSLALEPAAPTGAVAATSKKKHTAADLQKQIAALQGKLDAMEEDSSSVEDEAPAKKKKTTHPEQERLPQLLLGGRRPGSKTGTRAGSK